MPDFQVPFRDLLHAVNLRHETDGFIEANWFSARQEIPCINETRNLVTAFRIQTRVSSKARVVRRGRVFRDYGLLPDRLPGARGYLGGEDFMRLEDFMANCTREWTCDIVHRDYDSVCNNFRCAIGNWWSGKKILNPVWRLYKSGECCAVGVTDF
jgi:hypothetical protein